MKVPTANVEINCPLLTRKTKVACYDTEFDVVIGNVYDAKCFCSISEKSEKMNDKDEEWDAEYNITSIKQKEHCNLLEKEET